MKKRYVLKNKMKFISFMIIVSIILCCTIFATASYGINEKQCTTITVKSGDTLWDIAKTYCNKGDIRKYIFEIKKINGLSESIIYPGDELKIPA